MAGTSRALFGLEAGPVLPALERLAPPPPEQIVAAEIEARTAPGDIVIEPHGRGGWVARSAVNRLRRAFVIESAALTRLQAEIVLRPPDLRHLDAAFNALAVQPRGGVGLRQSILDDFGSNCPRCGRTVVVEEYLWEAGAHAPARKVYRCDGCRDRPGSADLRSTAVDAHDVRRAELMWETGSVSWRTLRHRFPAPDADHPLPDELLDLYTPRTLDAIGALVERIEADLRAAPIEAALRLALVHLILPASRLNRHMGRPQTLRISGGRLRRPTESAWRERNPWLLFEEGARAVRAFILGIEGAPSGSILARPGTNLAALLDGSANVVLRQGSAATPGVGPQPPRALRPRDEMGLPRPRLRLVLAQPPIRWTPENLGFAYLATSLAMGREAALSLPTEAIFETRVGSETSWEVAAMRRSLASLAPMLAEEARVVVLLDPSGPSGLAAAVLGGVAAGLQLKAAVLAEVGDEIGGTLEFTTAGPEEVEAPAAVVVEGKDQGDEAQAPLTVAVLEAAVTEVAVEVLQARGEPARFERLLGEVLIGLDRQGVLRRLVSTRAFLATGERAERAAQAMGLFGELPPSTPTSGGGNGYENAGADGVPSGSGSWRDPGRNVRQPVAVGPGPATTEEGAVPASGWSVRPQVRATSEKEEEAEAASVEAESADPDEWEARSGASDPVKLLLEVVIDELKRPEHSRLAELEPGRWWLRDPADSGAAGAPLSDRLEWAVFSLLSTSGGLSEAAFLDRVSGMFRGHDTPDEELVRACLASYGAQDRATGLLRTEDTLRDRYAEHGALVGMLTAYGHRLGLRCWVSRHEQRRVFKDAPIAALLSDVERRVYLPLVAHGEASALEAMDCIWYVRGKASFLFEVEWTAMLSEPVMQRGSRIPTDDTVVRFLVIPPERTELVRLKLDRSPVLRGAMEAGNWHILKSDHLRRLYAREEADLRDLEPMLGLDPEIERQGEQLPLFS